VQRIWITEQTDFITYIGSPSNPTLSGFHKIFYCNDLRLVAVVRIAGSISGRQRHVSAEKEFSPMGLRPSK
jgi:hypothetical protein